MLGPRDHNPATHPGPRPFNPPTATATATPWTLPYLARDLGVFNGSLMYSMSSEEGRCVGRHVNEVNVKELDELLVL